jgi:hypothetical protein
MSKKKATKKAKPKTLADEIKEAFLASLEDYLSGKSQKLNTIQVDRPKNAADRAASYPLKLTDLQRKSLIESTEIDRKIKVRLTKLRAGTEAFVVTRAELDHLNDEVGAAIAYAVSPHKKRLQAVKQKIEALFEADRREQRGKATTWSWKPDPKSGTIYQFKITLLDVEPTVWRRILVPECDLGQFHRFVQAAMGWQNCHMHRFEIDGEQFGPASPMDFDPIDDMGDEDEYFLSQLLPKSDDQQATWLYEYDFGDGWQHEILFEGVQEPGSKSQSPACLEGERACPPEDCGGPWGYPEYLAAISNPKHEQHKDFLEWRGPFNPEAFDAKLATKEMKKGLQN